MPTIESFYKMEEVSSEFVLNGIKTSTVLILDCRSQSDFQNGHIQGAMHVNLPPLLLRRLKKGSLAVATAVQGNDMKEKFSSECNYKEVIVYEAESCDINANCNNLLPLIHQKLVQENCKVKLLSGGYKMFSCAYPEYVETEEANENCPVTAGLSSLNLIEPSTPKSASEVTHSPSFPIEVIRHLYLGNAKCSMDSEALLKHNIRYILNVTPNLPNHFEGSSDVDITYKQIPINDHWSQNLSLYFPEAMAFIGEHSSEILGPCR